MAFGNISTFHIPVAGSAGTSQWGSDVRKLLDTADGTSDATTITSHGTGTSPVQRTFDPYTTNSADSAEADYGWAITPSDMNSVAGALRLFPAGDHTATVRMKHNIATAQSATLYMYVFRVGDAASSRARTLLGSNTAAISLAALSAETTYTVTVNLSEVVFAADETVQYSFELNAPGVVISGRNVTFYTGTRTDQIRVDTPGLRVLADTTGSAAGSATGAGVTGKVLGAEGASAGSATASGSMSSVSTTTGSASGVGTADGAMSSVAGMVGSSTGTGAASGALTVVGAMIGASTGTSTASGSLGATGSMTGTADGAATATGSTAATAATTGSATGLGEASGAASSVAGTTGTAAGLASISGQTSVVLGMTGTVQIGTGAPDYPVTNPTHEIAGTVINHETGLPVTSATVRLFRVSDDTQMQVTTSNDSGAYQFLRDTADPYTYYVIAEYTVSGTQIHGVTDRGLVPTPIV